MVSSQNNVGIELDYTKKNLENIFCIFQAFSILTVSVFMYNLWKSFNASKDNFLSF